MLVIIKSKKKTSINLTTTIQINNNNLSNILDLQSKFVFFLCCCYFYYRRLFIRIITNKLLIILNTIIIINQSIYVNKIMLMVVCVCVCTISINKHQFILTTTWFISGHKKNVCFIASKQYHHHSKLQPIHFKWQFPSWNIYLFKFKFHS